MVGPNFFLLSSRWVRWRTCSICPIVDDRLFKVIFSQSTVVLKFKSFLQGLCDEYERNLILSNYRPRCVRRTASEYRSHKNKWRTLLYELAYWQQCIGLPFSSCLACIISRWSCVWTLISLGVNWLTSKLTRNSFLPSRSVQNMLLSSVEPLHPVVFPGRSEFAWSPADPPVLTSSGRSLKKSLRMWETCEQ